MFKSMLLSSLMIVTACGNCAFGAVTIEMPGTPPLINAKDQQSVLFVIAKGGALSNFKCSVISLVPEHGDPVPQGAITCSAPTQIDSGKIEQIALSLSDATRLKRGSY